jgi:hypothetical protein
MATLGMVCLALALATPGCNRQAPGAAAPHVTRAVIRAGGDPATITVTDVNHDAVPDLVATNPDADSITVLLGDGAGRFHAAPGSPFAAGHAPSNVATGDFNGDGNVDLAIANHQAPYVTLLLGDGKGGFSPAPDSPFATSAKPHPHGIVAGRFCGPDQPLDAVIDSWGTSEIELLTGDGAGHLAAGRRFAAGPGTDAPLLAADVDGNGTLDIVMPGLAIGRWDANTATVLLGDGRCGFTPAPGSPFRAGAEPWSVAVGDLNGDGKPDLVFVPFGPQVRDSRQIGVTVALGDGAGGFHPMTGSPFALPGCSDPYRAAIGDFDRDGFPDIAVTCARSHRLFLLLGQQGGGYRLTWLELTDARPSGYVQHGIASADLDGDGVPDLAVTDSSNGTIVLLLSR